jgi:hypothetical protein
MSRARLKYKRQKIRRKVRSRGKSKREVWGKSGESLEVWINNITNNK